MKFPLKLFFFITNVILSHGVSLYDQLQHIAKRRSESLGYGNQNADIFRRRMPEYENNILGAPSYPEHLPEAEPILPGHTLIRPALGMLKSALRFPHKERPDGEGVYGNIETLGLTYGGTNERVLYSGFRRNLPSDYIMLEVPSYNKKIEHPDFKVSSITLDKDKSEKVLNLVLKELQRLKRPRQKKNLKVFIAQLNQPESEKLKHLNNKKNSKYLADPSSKWNTIKYENLQNEEISESSKEPKFHSILKGVLDDVLSLKSYIDSKNSVNAEYRKKHTNDKMLHQTKKNRVLIEKLLAQQHNDTDSSNIDNVTDALDSNDGTKNDFDAKNKWRLNSQHMFDHVHINSEAPDHEELMPSTVDTNLKKWWYFVQDDFQSLSNRKDVDD